MKMSETRTEASLGMHTRFNSDPDFPAAEIESCIRDALAAQTEAQNVLRPRPVSTCEPQIDSLVVVEIICAIEEIVGVDLPPTFSPRGGYDDVETCVTDLVNITRAVWVELVKEKENHE